MDNSEKRDKTSRYSIKWWNSGRYTFRPDHLAVIMWTLISNMVIYALLFLTAFVLAFDYKLPSIFSFYETIGDAIMIVDICVTFLTAIPYAESMKEEDRMVLLSVDSQYNHDMLHIVVKFISNGLIMNLITSVPTFVTFNSVKILYRLKILKFAHLGELQRRMLQAINFLKDFYFVGNAYTVESYVKIGLSIFQIVVFIHLMTCIWISIGTQNSEGWLTDWCTENDCDDVIFPSLYTRVKKWFNQDSKDQGVLLVEYVDGQQLQIYFDAFEFICQTITKVGYGTYGPLPSTYQVIFMMLIQFCAIFWYTLLTERFLSSQHVESVN